MNLWTVRFAMQPWLGPLCEWWTPNLCMDLLTPCRLGCGHIYCFDCLESWSKEVRLPRTYLRGPEKYYSCPSCRTRTKIKVPTVFGLIDFFGKVAAANPEGKQHWDGSDGGFYLWRVVCYIPRIIFFYTVRLKLDNFAKGLHERSKRCDRVNLIDQCSLSWIWVPAALSDHVVLL